MRTLLRERGAEALIGLLVVLLAIWFVIYAWKRTGGGGSSHAVHVTALFSNAAGIDVGTDVMVAGLKVGTVSAQRLDPKSFQAEETLALDPSVPIPSDSSAAVTSAGILGGSYIALIPGGSTTPLKNGDMILDTQGSVDLMSMVGHFINSSGPSSGASAGGGHGASPAAGAAAASGATTMGASGATTQP